MSKKILIPLAIFILFLVIFYYFFGASVARLFYAPQNPPADLSRGSTTNTAYLISGDYEVVAQDLKIPWEIAFLPDGDLLVTERPGTLLRIPRPEGPRSRPTEVGLGIGKDKKAYRVEGVVHQGEGGLLGMALHPAFRQNNWIYLYLTSRVGGDLVNRVERYVLEKDRLSEKTLIIGNIPGASYHDGGRIEFGLDGMLYVTTGDAGKSNLAQDINSLAGKILRVREDGSIPADNPFGNAVWSYGHRNVQGIAWDDQGRLWATEHGRSGILSGFDELNLIEKGKNYGWPEIQGNEKRDGMEAPVFHSGADYTWAPADIEYMGGSLFFGGLRGEALYEVTIPGGEIPPKLKINFSGAFGRVRAVRLGPDGNLYITTSNTDGRGMEREGDDKIVRLYFRPAR
ncbi:MAG: PQQ-dependent sugar dehydrogenase [Candidatus Sungbacteria bacterium]|nr:PQQ-dependent sugar dehydrogenase [Candidatus Sungbacteria bacterium]